MSDDRCGATLVYLNPGSEYACILDRGHEGAHQDMDGDLWTIRFPDEPPKLVYLNPGALDGLRGRIERLEDSQKQLQSPVPHPAYRVLDKENDYDVVTTLNSILVVLKDIRKAI